MERLESIRATPAQGYGCGSASAFNAAFVGENEPKVTSFLVEDLDEVLELSD